MNDYELLDSGDGRKLERFGPYVLMRPCSQAIWRAAGDAGVWQQAHTEFTRAGGLQWKNRDAIPRSWDIEVDGIRFRLSGTDFGHVGIFPEQRDQWAWIRDVLRAAREGRSEISVLHLFAYSGGATLSAALAGASVCHVDASRGMVAWARENAALNQLTGAPIRWIIDDVHRFLKREIKRGRSYDGIILDPPSFGRGARGEVYKIERDLPLTLDLCRQLLSPNPVLVLLTCHTPGFTPLVLRNLLVQMALPGGWIESGEMVLRGAPDVLPVPSGSFARWAAGAWKGAKDA